MKRICLFVCIILAAEIGICLDLSEEPIQFVVPKSRDPYKTSICPLCEKTRTECNAINEAAEAARKRGQTAAVKPCAVHDTANFELPSVPVRCPVCSYLVNVPRQDPVFTEYDSDLCFHRAGQNNFTSFIVMCQNCGFSAPRENKAFENSFPKEELPLVKNWVFSQLQPVLRAAQREILMLKRETVLSDAVISRDFSFQRSLPDPMRCENAYMFFKNRPNADHTSCAELAKLTAWAYRRIQYDQFKDRLAQEAEKGISDAIQQELVDAHTLAAIDLLDRVAILQKFINDRRSGKKHFTGFDIQIMQLMLATYFNRLGYNAVATRYYQNVYSEAAHDYSNALHPWIRHITDSALRTEAESSLRSARTFLATVAQLRFNYQAKEIQFLGIAVDHIIQSLTETLKHQTDIKALEHGGVASSKIPETVFLVAEFERRRDNLSRAKLWLTAATHMIKEPYTLAHEAPATLDELNQYVKRIVDSTGQQPPVNLYEESDKALLLRLVERWRKSVLDKID